MLASVIRHGCAAAVQRPSGVAKTVAFGKTSHDFFGMDNRAAMRPVMHLAPCYLD